jgi:hypothetical protein
MSPFFKEKHPVNFSLPPSSPPLIQDEQTEKGVLQKELDVNLVEQNLLQQRILMMQSFINDLASSDPQYSMLCIQVKMDLLEIDELKRRGDTLVKQIEKH